MSIAASRRRNVAALALPRLGAWLGVVALLLQMLAVPLSAPRAAWADQGLFAPACTVHQPDDGTAPLVADDCRQCTLCQIQTHDGQWAVPSHAIQRGDDGVAMAPAPHFGPETAAASPPPPPRAPPSAA